MWGKAWGAVERRAQSGIFMAYGALVHRLFLFAYFI